MRAKIIGVVLIILLLMFLISFGVNFYFVKRLNDQIKNSNKEQRIENSKTEEDTIKTKLNKYVGKTKPIYLNRNPRYYAVQKELKNHYVPTNYDNNINAIWQAANLWAESNELFPENDPIVKNIMYAMKNEPIFAAKNYKAGTQLKLLFNITGTQQVVFKPKWYSRNHIVNGPVYAGKDRHTAEVFGFYLSIILNFRSTPIAVGRYIDTQQILDVADEDLKATMVKNGNQTCFYGKCYYCKKSERVCGQQGSNLLEGVVIYYIPGTIRRERSPWQRTYKRNVEAAWETNAKYCESLKQVLPETRLLDLVEASIFDFLVQNGDRHHYETRNDRILLLDNGKGFGNPYKDFIDILAPLYQCCILRRSTWLRLKIFSGGALTELIDELTKNDVLHPILTKDHLEAVERRLIYVYATVEWCIDNHGKTVFR